MTKIEQNVKSLIEPIITNLGYTIYDVIYEKEGQDNYLRIFIDKPEGTIDLNDCEKVSGEINNLLDEADYITDQYFLEVSSPGIERVLRKDKHLKDNIGNDVELKLFKKINNTKLLQGNLIDFNESYITIETDKEKLQIDRKDISIIKTVYNW